MKRIMRSSNMKNAFAGILTGTMFMTACLSACLTAAVPVSAQEVTVRGSACSLQVMSSREEGAESETMELQSFQLFGRAGDDLMLIRIAGEDGYGPDVYVRQEELQSQLPKLDCDSFPDIDKMEPIEQGSTGEDVLMLQTVLASQGFTEGGFDGEYGQGTANSVLAFQGAHGLNATGIADVYTMMLITALNDGLEDSVKVSVGDYDTPEEKFPEIVGKTDADLTKFMDVTWQLNFDDIKDTGTIDPALTLGYFEVPSPDIDRITGIASIKEIVQKDEASDTYILTPAIVVETEGSYRPYLQGARLVSSESGSLHLEGGTSTGAIEGATLKETGYIPLTEEAIAMLREGAESIRAIRLLGKNTEYDLEIDIDKRALDEVMEAM